ncbi:ribose-phosphate diphosphokinase [Wolbachia endosymbiont of Ctenocephalides felis wCfeT]|uniref:ribose-phosphate diphosphokinase n=1 Tax=Wolbachia endosymbiont of Ctenocephalides felis wCfeT TaxID=2732593 RepID=UPI001447EE53|nr:ribose-phosphate diphosphokinase [Wolbachia endosymbiont of Ctenocephalides felis wCfeT]
MKIIIGNASRELVISEELSPCNISKFADGELNVEVESNLYNQEVYIVQSISPPVNDNLMELLLMIDAVKRADAKKITAVIPYYGYSRQDRIIKNNNMQSALSAQLVANLIQTAGANSIAAFDLHSTQIEGFFNVPVVNLSCFEVFAQSIKKEDLAVVAPDVGAIGRARAFAKVLEAKHNVELNDKIVVVDKYREKAGISQVMNIIGEVAGKNCVIVDDIVDSGGTLCNAALAIKNQGAKSVTACITHGVLSGNAIEKISSSVLDKLIVTDTVLHKFEKIDKIEVVSIADILMSFILKTQGDKSA